ncbi:MAG: helix-hairpin-helix domain-containing protein, partial [Candidatus Fimenecus sp.]
NRHRTRAIAQNGGEIEIRSNRRVFTLISEIQEEVHRFSVSYHRSKHAKRNLTMSLTEIDGVGEATAKLLLKEFKTISKIKAASVNELCAAEGIGRKTAEKIYVYYHKEDENE